MYRHKRRASKDNIKEIVSASRSRFSISDKPEEYGGAGLKNCLHGNIYQLKLLMLFLERAYKNKYSFRLSTEWIDGQQFNDVIIEYLNERKDGSVYFFLQAKHKQDETIRITLNDLLTESNNDFSLQKYFISYRKKRQNPKFNANNNELKNFVIYTNIGLHEDLKEYTEVLNIDQSVPDQRNVENDNSMDVDSDNNARTLSTSEVNVFDNILNLQTQNKDPIFYKFNKKFLDKTKIKEILKETSDCHRLAKKIAEATKLDLTDELIRQYHSILLKKVLEVIEGTNGPYAKFKMEFLNNSSETGEFHELYLALLEYLKGKDLKEVKISVPKNFGNPFQLKKDLAKIIAQAIGNAKKNMVDLNIIQNIPTLKKNIDTLAEHLLIKEDAKDTFYFTDKFFDEPTTLPADLCKFRKNLKAELQIRNIGFTKDEYKFKILNFPTCEDREQNLPNDFVTDEEINDFFDIFVSAVNQPNEVELGKIIENEMAKHFNLHDAASITSYFQELVLDWMKAKKGVFLTHLYFDEFLEKAEIELSKYTVKQNSTLKFK